ncbi:Pectinesterase [Bertholletia excelsa]
MASTSRTQLHFMLFLLSVSNVLLKSCSLNPEITGDYNKWISWHVDNYRKKTILESKLSTDSGTTGGNVVDKELMNAEMNRVRISVGQDANTSAVFKTINEALDSIPPHNSRRVIVSIKPGVYREKVVIPRTMPFVTLLGDASDPPIITGNDTASASGTDGRPLRTFQSATVAVDANYFVAVNIKFENTAPHVIGSVGGQAVAVRISGTKVAFYNCSFYGTQDTLYDHKGLHYFYNCFIQGSIDFIFGYGRSLYQNCTLNSVGAKVASLTAQKRSNSSLSSGFSFKDSKVTGSGRVYLGRAWGDYSRVIFSYTFMDKIVLPQGWSDWGNRKRDSAVYYGEYQCSGPGANLSARVPWARILTDQEAQPFLGTYYVEGDSWLIKPQGV